jgi:hypothetical protein
MNEVPDIGKAVNWNQRAWKRWRRARTVDGDGPFALLAHCRVLTITLHETSESAEKDKAMIDNVGCGGCCYKRHEIIDMRSRMMAS